jgi:quercetin dioxygenase-like cupin family protein
MSLFHGHAQDLPAEQGSADSFTGDVQIRIVAAGQQGPVSVGRVTFGRGARTHWHTHSGEQVLYFLEGQGRVQRRGDQVIDAVAGDIVRISAGEEHWHGAHPDEQHQMTHLAITFGTPTWLEPVSDEQYRGQQI